MTATTERATQAVAAGTGVRARYLGLSDQRLARRRFGLTRRRLVLAAHVMALRHSFLSGDDCGGGRASLIALLGVSVDQNFKLLPNNRLPSLVRFQVG